MSSGETRRAAMIHVHTPQGSWWEVGLLSPRDWHVAMHDSRGSPFKPRDGITIWSHPDLRGGGHIRFATDDAAWHALRGAWPAYARPILPRLHVARSGDAVESVPPTPPEQPHSPAWIARLAASNPCQALLVRAAVRCAGTVHCCGICGDTSEIADYVIPADDYGAPTTARTVHTVRLCNDCRAIQHALYGLVTLPLQPEGA